MGSQHQALLEAMVGVYFISIVCVDAYLLYDKYLCLSMRLCL